MQTLINLFKTAVYPAYIYDYISRRLSSTPCTTGNMTSITTIFYTYDSGAVITISADTTTETINTEPVDFQEKAENHPSFDTPYSAEQNTAITAHITITPNPDMLYYGYRFLSPDMGRWINRDPIGEFWGMNGLYAMASNNLIDGVDVLGLAESCYCARIQDIDVETELVTSWWTSAYKYRVKFIIYLVGLRAIDPPVSDPDCTLIQREENFSDSRNVQMYASGSILYPGSWVEKTSKEGVDFGEVRKIVLDHPMGWVSTFDSGNRTMHFGVTITIRGGEGCEGSKSASVEAWLRVAGGKPDSSFERIEVSYE